MKQVRVGDVIEVDEADYMYGVGVLRLRVTELQGVYGRAWLGVRGIQILHTGALGPERQVTVRIKALVDRGWLV